nr:phosphotransferase [Corynebacterium halotolerans]
MTNEDIVETAEDLLSKRFGGAQRLSEVQELSGSGSAVVLRARVASSPFLQQRSVILKYVPVSGEALDDAALVREVVAYQFTNSLSEEVRPGPVLLAHDIDRRIIVITDSGDGDTFEDLLNQRDPEIRVQILRNLGTALGRMHSGTAGREQDFEILLTRMLRQHPGSAEIQHLRDRSLLQSIQLGEELLRQGGVEVPEVVSEMARDAAGRLMSARHRAFTPFDLSPDNIIVADKTHFLDYEWAGFRDVSFDLACVIAGFPQFVFSRPVSDDEADVFVESWTQEVSALWPNVNNESHLHARVLAALIGWALSSVSLMHFGSMSNAVATFHREGLISEEEWQAIGRPLQEEPDLEVTGDFLRPADEGPFTEDELLVRRDLYETFEALARYAARGTEPYCAVVAAFGAEIAERVTEPRI